MMDELLTLAQAAKEVNLKPVTLRMYATGQLQPKLPTTLIGGRHIVTRADFDAWVIARKQHLAKKDTRDSA